MIAEHEQATWAGTFEYDGDGLTVRFYGACPVQGDGMVDGVPLYFRARYSGWSVRIGEALKEDEWDDEKMWVSRGKWGDDSGVEAGFMPYEVALEFLKREIQEWRAK